jgi:DNA-binding CsgD family transcriptional regulator
VAGPGRPSAPLSRTWAYLVRGLIDLRRSGGGREDLDLAWVLAMRLDEPLRVMPAAAALAEQIWVTGEPDARLGHLVDVLDRFDQPGLEWARGDLASWLRRVDPSLGTTDRAVSAPHRLQLAGAHLEAAALWEKIEAPYDQALELVASEQPIALRHGLGILDRLGADVVASRLRQDLRDRGIASIPARARSATLSNKAGLTARELEVLALLDEGLSNSEVAGRLYISPKTADHHVSSILAKLRVPDRRQAARAGRKLGILG